MQSVILQPCGDSDANQHFIDTIQTPVLTTQVTKYLTDPQKLQLAPLLHGREAMPVWGVTPGKKNVNFHKWQRIAVGDASLFSRDGRIFATSTVAQKIHNKPLALDLWQTNADDETWEYIYFLDEITYVDIPYLKFNRAVGYADNYVIQGFNVLDAEKSESILSAFDLRSDRYQPEVDQKAFQDAIMTALSGLKETDANYISAGRVEQSYLRKHLFQGKVQGQCSLCGENFPVDLLIASHVKKRSECSKVERLDYQHVVAPMCLLGCDALYEKGYVIVSKQGAIEKGRIEVEASGLGQHFARVLGRNCSGWSPTSEKYFAWHRQRFIRA